MAQKYAQVMTQLAATPINGVVGPDEWDDIFLTAGYVQFVWPELGGVFADFVNKGAGAAVVAEYRSTDTPGDDNSFAVYNAVSCVDDTWKDENFLADQAATYATAPFLTWGNAWFNAPCLSLAGQGAPRTRITGAGVGRALLVDETLDAATPYSGSLYLRSIFRKSRLIAVPGGTNHAISPSGNSCVDDKIFRYLATGRLPARKAGTSADVRCRPLPLPQPDPPSPRFAASPSLSRVAGAGDADDRRRPAGAAPAGRRPALARDESDAGPARVGRSLEVAGRQPERRAHPAEVHRQRVVAPHRQVGKVGQRQVLLGLHPHRVRSRRRDG